MKRIFSALVVITILFTTSCHKDKEDAPAGYIEYQGQLLEVMDPVKYDSNGDGVIDEKDKAIEILGTNLNITENPDGSHFYSGSSNQGGEEEPIPGGGGSSSENSSLVPVGEKLCYHDLAKYCKQNGGLYAFETSANGPQASIKQTFTNDDANKNGIADYIEEIRAPKNIEKLATTHSKTYSSETEQKIEKATGGKQISESFIQTTIKEAVIDALEEALYESNETVDITNVETIVKTKTEYALKEAVKEAGLSEYLSDKDIEEIAGVTAEKVAKDVANAIATTVSNTILKQSESQASSGTIQNVQGICPNGSHVASWSEWKELFLGIGAEDPSPSHYWDDAAAPLMASESDNPGWIGDNTYGFSVLPAGYGMGTMIMGQGTQTMLTTSTLLDEEDAVMILFNVVKDKPECLAGENMAYSLSYGIANPIRCIKNY